MTSQGAVTLHWGVEVPLLCCGLHPLNHAYTQLDLGGMNKGRRDTYRDKVMGVLCPDGQARGARWS